MTQNLLFNLLSDLRRGLDNPGLLWQVIALVACLALGWGGARVLRDRLTTHDMQLRVMKFGLESFSKVLWPLLALLFIVLAKLILARWYQINLLRLAIPLVGSFALIRFAFYVLRRIFVRGGQAAGFLLMFERGFALVIWCGVAIYVIGLWPGVEQFLDGTVIPIGRHKVSLLVIAQAVISVVFTLFIALWAGALLEERLMSLDAMHSSLRAVVVRLGRAVFIFLAVLISFSLVGIDLTVLSVFGGALGVGIGLGLQKLVSSYVSGFVILLERSLKIGDVIAVDRFVGQVTQINTRYTVIRGADGIETVVPNDMLVSGPVQNHSLTDRMLRLSTRIAVSYKTDIDFVLPLLKETAASVERVSQEPEPLAALARFDADGFELEVHFWIEDPENGRVNVLSDVNRAIWKTLQKYHIEVPFPQREVRLLDFASNNGHREAAVMHAAETP